MAERMEETDRRWAVSGPFVPAGLFVGMGIGLALDHLVAGLFIGLGAGFLLMALLMFWSSSRAGREAPPRHPAAGAGTH